MTPPPPARRAWPGWALAVGAVAYAALLHHGVGPRDPAAPLHWYTPRGFALAWGWLDPLLEPPARAIAALAAPALLLAALALVTARSALATALALSACAATLLFLYYAFEFPFAWEFFHWRGSAVMIGVGLCVGGALAAPRLAARWLRLGWPLRLALYLPVAFAVFAAVGNATGTDASLRFAISPWPAIPVFGMEVGAAVVASWLAGMAAGTALRAAAPARSRAGAALGTLGALAAGAAIPAACVALADALRVFPFGVDARVLLGLAGVGALATAGALAGRREERGARARHLALGAALVALPLLLALAVERREYRATRDVRAQRILDALQSYYDAEAVYPDELGELVSGGYLAEIPEPGIGLAFLRRDRAFRYQSFGTGYILEFSAPRWVQCAYSPPWQDDEADAEGGEDDDASLAGAWSCPSEPPELW